MNALVAAASRPLRATASRAPARSSAQNCGQDSTVSSRSASRSVLVPRVSAGGLPAPAGTHWVLIGGQSGAGVRGMSGPAWGRSQGPLMKRWSENDQIELDKKAKEIENASPIVSNIKTGERLSMRQYYNRRKEVVLLVRDGGEKEELMLEEAVGLAESLGLDPVLVHIPTDKNDHSLAVLRFMDTGKKRHDLSKKVKESKKTQQVNTVKEVRIGYNIGQHDLEVRLKQAREFLVKGHRVKLFINLKPKEEKAVALIKIDEMVKLLEDYGAPDGPATGQGQVIKGVVVPHKSTRVNALANAAAKPPPRLSRKEQTAADEAAALQAEKDEADAELKKKAGLEKKAAKIAAAQALAAEGGDTEGTRSPEVEGSGREVGREEGATKADQ
eukprot:CAMPEP_0180212736 /NCGR_PEP_ID=MMETSP0987-20121128/13690_1 /TAXON_ID=697907 /ORGANISM="non described non described, Strain CCMP2293" /LENGTH=385 /DNA_ID=CAMNT_0022170485 /DNA_START=71 /DNA_END=1228 /DNA_ORIENTATION=+